MLGKIPISNSNIVIGATGEKLPNTKVITKGKVLVKTKLEGVVTVNGAEIQNINLSSYSELDKLPSVKAIVKAEAEKQATQLKCHVKFL